MSDPNFNNVSLLLHGEGATIVDSSKHHHAVAVTGNSQISTGQALFGSSSIFLDGNGDYLSFADAPEFNFGGGDFTIEVGFYLTSFKADTVATLLSKMSGGMAQDIAFALYLFGTSSSFHTIYFDAYDASNNLGRVPASYNFSLNTWYKLGVVREGNTVKIAVNNTVIHSQSFSTTIRTHAASVFVGCYFPSSGIEFYLPAYVDELRITKGVARDVTIAQTAPFDDFGYHEVLNLTSDIVATTFKASVYELDSGVLLNHVDVTVGSTIVETNTNAPVLFTIIPNQGNVWAASTAYLVDDLVFPTDPIAVPYYFKRLTAGNSGVTEPDWSAILTNDGTWQRVDRLAQPITISPVIPQ